VKQIWGRSEPSVTQEKIELGCDFLVKTSIQPIQRSYFLLGGTVLRGDIEPGMSACFDDVELKVLSISILDPLPMDSHRVLLCVDANKDPLSLIAKQICFYRENGGD
jgi:hypothetical protein